MRGARVPPPLPPPPPPPPHHARPPSPAPTWPPQAALPYDLKIYGCGFWLLALAGLSVAGAAALQWYRPAINQRFVSHLE